VFAPDDADQVAFVGQPLKSVSQCSCGPNVGLMGWQNARVTVFVQGFTERFTPAHPVENDGLDQLGFCALSCFGHDVSPRGFCIEVIDMGDFTA
jgi:hypothetical protein